MGLCRGDLGHGHSHSPRTPPSASSALLSKFSEAAQRNRHPPPDCGPWASGLTPGFPISWGLPLQQIRRSRSFRAGLLNTTSSRADRSRPPRAASTTDPCSLHRFRGHCTLSGSGARLSPNPPGPSTSLRAIGPQQGLPCHLQETAEMCGQKRPRGTNSEPR